MFLATPEEYAAQALEVKAPGIRGYKVHPPARRLPSIWRSTRLSATRSGRISY